MTFDVQKIGDSVKTLALKYALDAVILFGSQARERVHSKSDIDIAVLSRKELDMTKLAIDFYDLFGREDVEVVELRTASPTLMRVVLRDGKLLYEREPNIFLKWKFYAIKVWQDTEWLRNLRDKKLVEWARSN